MDRRFHSVLVTGGAGFIGSNYLLHMVPAYPDVRFVNLDALTYAGNLMNLHALEGNPNYDFVQGDVADQDLVSGLFVRHDFSAVVHFAAESHVDRSITDPLAFVRTNVLGTSVLLDAARRHWLTAGSDLENRLFHHISTDEVFGSLGASGAFSEETPYDPRSPYSASKAGSDHLVRAYGHTFGLPIVITNCSNNYGPFQFPEKLIPLMIRNCVEGKPLPVYGSGSNVRDWLFVGDHCTALERVLMAGRAGSTYAIGGRSERTNLEIVHLVCDLVDAAMDREPGTSRRLVTFVKDRPGHDFRYAIDCSRIERELGWTAARTLETGLRETVTWYIDHWNWVESVIDAGYLSYYARHYDNR